MSFLDYFEDTKISNNRFMVLPIDKDDEIAIGGHCTHCFEVPLDIDKRVKDIIITYVQGFTTIVQKTITDCKIKPHKFGTSLIVTLSPKDTYKFKYTQLDTKVQLKIIDINDTIIYSTENKLVIRVPINNTGKPYAITHLANNLDMVEYDTIDYSTALENYTSDLFACNSLFWGCAFNYNNFVGVNIDQRVDKETLSAIRVNADGDSVKYSSFGIAKQFDFEDEDLNYTMLPFYLLSGVNSKGVAVSVNLVYDDFGLAPKVFSNECAEIEFPDIFLARFILDNFDSAQEACQYIENSVDIKLATVKNYVPHILVSDKTNTYVIEFIKEDGKTKVVTVDNHYNYAGNFYIDGVVFNEDFTLYEPATSTFLLAGETTIASPDLIIKAYADSYRTNKLQLHSRGIERYNKLVAELSTLSGQGSVATIKAMLRKLNYSNFYRVEDVQFALSEVIFICEAMRINNDLAMDKSDFNKPIEKLGGKSIVEYLLDLYAGTQERLVCADRASLYKTRFTCIYDLNDRKIYIAKNESANTNIFQM